MCVCVCAYYKSYQVGEAKCFSLFLYFKNLFPALLIWTLLRNNPDKVTNKFQQLQLYSWEDTLHHDRMLARNHRHGDEGEWRSIQKYSDIDIAEWNTPVVGDFTQSGTFNFLSKIPSTAALMNLAERFIMHGWVSESHEDSGQRHSESQGIAQ